MTPQLTLNSITQLLTTKNLDFHQRRITNAGPAQDPSDYVTQNDALALIQTALSTLTNASITFNGTNFIFKGGGQFQVYGTFKLMGDWTEVGNMKLTGSLTVTGDETITGDLSVSGDFKVGSGPAFHVDNTGKIGFFSGTPKVQQVLSAYTSDPQSTAYTGVGVPTSASLTDLASKTAGGTYTSNEQAMINDIKAILTGWGTPYLAIADANALRFAYETIRVMSENLRSATILCTLFTH